MLANNSVDSRELNKFSKGEKSPGNLSEQETTVKSLNLSSEFISCLNDENAQDLKKQKEPTDQDITLIMFQFFHDKYIKKWT